MRTIHIYRLGYSHYGTFGMIVDDGIPVCLTAERPWEFNKSHISCIPHGTYVAKREWYISKSGKKYKAFILQDVPARTRIFIHKGNNPIKDTEGCIIIGKGFNNLPGAITLTDSAKAFETFMWHLGTYDKIKIVIHPDPDYEQSIARPSSLLRETRRHLEQDRVLKPTQRVYDPKDLEVDINLADKITYYWGRYRDDLGDFLSMAGKLALTANPLVGGAAIGVGKLLSISGESPLKKGEKTGPGIAWDKVINLIMKILGLIFKKGVTNGK